MDKKTVKFSSQTSLDVARHAHDEINLLNLPFWLWKIYTLNETGPCEARILRSKNAYYKRLLEFDFRWGKPIYAVYQLM